MAQRRPEGRHLRLALETDGQRLDVVQAWVGDQPLVPATHVAGPLVYEVFMGGSRVWLETLADPLEERGFARPNERAHYVSAPAKGSFVVAVPLTAGQLSPDLRIRIFRATGPLPLTMAGLGELLATSPLAGLQRLGTLDFASLMRHPDFERLRADGQLAVAPEPRQGR